jgi:hypothetical protein
MTKGALVAINRTFLNKGVQQCMGNIYYHDYSVSVFKRATTGKFTQ